jgi:hypothetical protein
VPVLDTPSSSTPLNSDPAQLDSGVEDGGEEVLRGGLCAGAGAPRGSYGWW